MHNLILWLSHSSSHWLYVGISLMVLNITIFVAGILASFFRHDAHGAYEKTYNTYEQLRVSQYKNQEKVERKRSILFKKNTTDR